ncbi:hypothetical protein [Marivirga harenae]|uniref:hypothetical protein n=1 Tax=Marivirga harenae TaxID=2010992 RepID=UPI0026DF2B3A|nr:hypothetical protein [Marivirga harenae]WKV11356.1 hypothetical protein Q3Y49_14200 [Marivirga harenae]
MNIETMDNVKKVLILGIGQTNFLGPLYKIIKRSNPHLKFFLNRKKVLSDDITDDNDLFNKQNENRFSVFSFFSLFKTIYLKVIFLTLIEEGFKKFLINAYFIIESIYLFDRKDKYDIYHYHFVNFKNLISIPLLKKNRRIIVSFWGSDLLRNYDMINHFFVRYALLKADVITIQSLDLKEFLVTKYGRDLYEKIKVIKFKLDQSIFENIDSINNENDKSNFIDDHKVNILVGHNANTANRHKEIIEALKDLSAETKAKINLIFVFSYGIENADFLKYYKGLLIEKLCEYKFQYVFIDSFLSQKEIAKLRKFANINIHLPVSDALSAAITETMYAENLVITGAWLPYGPFRRKGIFFSEIGDFNQLAEKVGSAVCDWDLKKRKLVGNRQKVIEEFLNQNIEEDWCSVYNF